jgi:hypothetical protein
MYSRYLSTGLYWIYINRSFINTFSLKASNKKVKTTKTVASLIRFRLGRTTRRSKTTRRTVNGGLGACHTVKVPKMKCKLALDRFIH